MAHIEQVITDSTGKKWWFDIISATQYIPYNIGGQTFTFYRTVKNNWVRHWNSGAGGGQWQLITKQEALGFALEHDLLDIIATLNSELTTYEK